MSEWLSDLPPWLQECFRADAPVDFRTLLASLSAACVLGCLVAVVYALTHRGEQAPAQGFIPTLVLLTVMIALVTQVIGNNQARAFSLVGTLAIIRFRTVVEDTRDTAFVIFAVVIGMAVGAGGILMALAGVAVGAVTAFLVRPRRPALLAPDEGWLLNLRLGIGSEQQAAAEAVLRKAVDECRTVAAATARQGAALEVTYQLRLRLGVEPAALVAELNLVAGVQGAELRRR
jgi:hypothetical protein